MKSQTLFRTVPSLTPYGLTLTLSQHTKAVSKSCFYHIRALKQIRGSLDDATLCTVATALVSSRLDYANSILYGIPTKHTSRLQRHNKTPLHVLLQVLALLTLAHPL